MGAQQVGRYELVRPIGRGGMGEVWEAFLVGPRGFRRRVALKLLRQGTAGDEDALAHEARLGALLQHPNIVSTLELGEADGRWYVAMEFVAGTTAAALIKARRLPVGAALDVALQACIGLAHAHALEVDGRRVGLVHRDVKPGNLLVDPSGVVKVADLGIARLATDPGRPAGTRGFVAPEQARGEGEDHRADLFSLGATLYACLTGERPFANAHSVAAVEALLANPTLFRPLDEAVPGLGAVFARCVRGDRADRWPDAHALANALRSLRARAPEGPSLAELVTGGAGGETAESTSLSPPRTEPMLGREQEILAFVARLEARPGVVALLGPGGVGKTRLLRAGLRCLTGWPTWYVDLAHARDADAAVAAVAAALGVPLAGERTSERLFVALRSHGASLLALDTPERMVGPIGSLVAEWCAQAPALRVALASRVAIPAAQDGAFRVGPLNSADGAALFRQRAQRALGPEEERALPDLVAALDGLPLAIELAAGRARLVRVPDLLLRLKERFRLLAGGDRDRPERQRSLAASLEASWELLTPFEHAALGQLAVFAGSFDLAAAEAVIDLRAWPGAPWTLDVLATLVDHSLLWMEQDRFRLLATVRDFATERAKPESRATLRHASWYAQLGSEAWLAALATKDRLRRLKELEVELENLRLAAETLAALGDPEAIRAALAWWAATEPVGPYGPAVAWMARIADAVGEGPKTAPLRIARGRALAALGRYDEAVTELEAARAGSQGDAGWALVALATLEADRSASERARLAALEAIRQFREVGDRRGEAAARSTLGRVFVESARFAEAGDELAQAIQLARAVGDEVILGVAISRRGFLSNATAGDFLAGEADFKEAGALAARMGDRTSEAVNLGNEGVAHQLRRAWPEARALFERALAIHRQTGVLRGQAVIVSYLAFVECEAGTPESANALLDEATALAVAASLPRSLAILAHQRFILCYRLGQHVEAERWIRACGEHAPAAGPEWVLKQQLTLALFLASKNRGEEAIALLRRPEPATRTAAHNARNRAAIQAIVELWFGDREAAFRAIARARESEPPKGTTYALRWSLGNLAVARAIDEPVAPWVDAIEALPVGAWSALDRDIYARILKDRAP